MKHQQIRTLHVACLHIADQLRCQERLRTTRLIVRLIASSILYFITETSPGLLRQALAHAFKQFIRLHVIRILQSKCNNTSLLNFLADYTGHRSRPPLNVSFEKT